MRAWRNIINHATATGNADMRALFLTSANIIKQMILII